MFARVCVRVCMCVCMHACVSTHVVNTVGKACMYMYGCNLWLNTQWPGDMSVIFLN